MTVEQEREYREQLYDKIEILSRRLWGERRIDRAHIDRWLDNFGPDGDAQKERLHALYLLSKTMFFPNRELRELIRALYRDRFKYPIVRDLRAQHGSDPTVLEALFRDRLERTRFLGIGNPSESGTHLLYYFRQENRLSADLFISSHEIFEPGSGRSKPRAAAVTDYVVLDDFCGSGDTAVDYFHEVVADLKRAAPNVTVHCYSLFATKSGLGHVEAYAQYDEVDSIFVLGDSYRCFDAESMYFRAPDPPIDKAFAEALCRDKGADLWPSNPFGYRDGQLLLAFSHNTPDNSLPVLWYDEPLTPWAPIFPRYPKVW